MLKFHSKEMWLLPAQPITLLDCGTIQSRATHKLLRVIPDLWDRFASLTTANSFCLALMTRPSKSSKPLTVNSYSLFLKPIKTGLNRANSLRTLALLHLVPMTVLLSSGTSTLVNRFTLSRTTVPVLTLLSSILMAHVFLAEVRTNLSRSGISEARGWSNTTMLTAPTLTKLISTPTVDTSSQAAPILPWRFGISDKATSCILSMAMRAPPHLQTSRHVVTTSRPVVLTP